MRDMAVIVPAAGRRPSAPGSVRGDIEGLRAVAVGAVLLFHLGAPWISGGFAGVDLFFVISGFLITSLLLREVAGTGTLSITGFYARRARRLLPAATVVLVFSAVAGWALLPASQHAYLAVDVAAASLYVVNWVLASRSVDYLAEDAGLSPVQHYWSLSVEEQYYLVWPLLMIVGLRTARRWGVDTRRLLVVVVLAVAVASFGYSIVHTRQAPAEAYFVSTTRVWELAIGSLLAFAVTRLRLLPRQAAQALALVGIALLAYAVLLLDTHTPWPGWAAAVPTLGTALVIAAGCADRETAVARALAVRPMVWLGGISYALYLWHWPLIVLAEARWSDLSAPSRCLIGVVSILLAWATKHVIEDPVRFNRVLVGRPTRSLVAGAVAMCLSLTAAAAVRSTVPTLDPSADVPGASALVANPRSTHWRVLAAPDHVYTTSGAVTPAPAVAPADAPLTNGCQAPMGGDRLRTDCVFGQRDSATRFALLGDSKMAQWFPAVNRIAHREGWRLEVYLKSACTTSLVGVTEDCAGYNRKVLDHFEEEGAPDYALVSVRGSSYDADTGGLSDELRRLTRLGTHVVLLADNVSPGHQSVYDCVEANPGRYDRCSFDRAAGVATSGTVVLAESAAELGLPLIDLNEWICPSANDRCPAVIAGTLVYRQGSHITATYIKTLTPMLHRALSRLGVAQTPVRRISVPRVGRPQQ
jgi:peptidoglycan/LPS O-acetylase OafA/YrhL